MTEKLRRQKETHESTLNPLVNQFNKVRQGIDIKKQEMSAIEGKAAKIRGEIEAVRNHINLNLNKVKAAQEDIDRLKASIQQIEEEQKECDNKLKYLGEEQTTKERELQKFRENLGQMKSS